MKNKQKTISKVIGRPEPHCIDDYITCKWAKHSNKTQGVADWIFRKPAIFP